LSERSYIDAEPVIVIVSRDQVETRDTASVIGALKSCVASTERALSFFEKLDIAFHGYDQTRASYSKSRRCANM
jgi:hypothetical protein